MPYDWPSLLIGLLMGFYWYRVLRKAWHVKKRTGRAGNIMPAEPVGQFLRLIWYPVIVVWIVHPLARAFSKNPQPFAQLLFDVSSIRWAAFGVAVLAMVATLVCWKRMGRSWRMGIDPAEKTALGSVGLGRTCDTRSIHCRSSSCCAPWSSSPHR